MALTSLTSLNSLTSVHAKVELLYIMELFTLYTMEWLTPFIYNGVVDSNPLSFLSSNVIWRWLFVVNCLDIC